MAAPLTAFAPAKVNLFLHVGPPRPDGYHPLTSLVAFADVGDGLTAQAADRLSLTVGGPFGKGLDGEGDNLVLRAVRALASVAGRAEPGLAFHLDKRLPIAAGLGGGSSDAGAALRLVRDHLWPDLEDAALVEAARVVGADGPMCLAAVPAWAEGAGEVLTPEPRLPPLPAVLVNPGVASPTGPVYRAYDAAPRPLEALSAPDDWSVGGVCGWLAAQRNDLQGPAVALVPAIAPALRALEGTEDGLLTRMSGSGATCFGLFGTTAQAEAAARTLAAAHPDWWVRATVLGAPPLQG